MQLATVIASVATDWLAALGTVGAVVIALSLQLALPLWRRPRLDIRGETIPEPITDTDNDGVTGQWWDIPVENRGRGNTAIETQVMLTNVLRLDGSGTHKTRVPLRSLKWTHLADARADIPAGITRSVELGNVRPTGVGPLTLGIYPPLRGSERNQLQPGTYRFEMALVARNARALYYRFDAVLHDGNLTFPTGITKMRRPEKPPGRT